MSALELAAVNNATWTAGPFPLKDDADVNIALPAAAAVRMQVRTAATDTSVAIELTRANGFLVIDADDATVSIEVPVANMRDLPSGAYVFDVIVEQPTGRVLRPLYGTLAVEAGVTR